MNPKNDHNQPQDDTKNGGKSQADHAADLIRKKLDDLYANEGPKTEALKGVEAARARSRHQQFMLDLSKSGKSLAEIQIAWHKYYEGLSDQAKHEVWKEFYETNNQSAHFALTQAKPEPAVPQQPINLPKPLEVSKPVQPISHDTHKPSSVSEVKKRLLKTARPKRKLSAKQHFQSVFFGLGLGAFVVLIFMFSFFNERFIAPFISPSHQVSSTPIIGTGSAPKSEHNVIIPKINVDIPVVYDEPSIEDGAIQKALQRGAVHYATTSSPGQKGNAVIFGHSSNNIFNPGNYKFAFTLLSRVSIGDIFYLTKDGTRYTYKIYQKEVVPPTEVSVLDNTNKVASATLITCDPPGTSSHRLVVIGEQISPDPSIDKASTAIKSSRLPTIIPSNAPSLWQRIKNWFGG